MRRLSLSEAFCRIRLFNYSNRCLKDITNRPISGIPYWDVEDILKDESLEHMLPRLKLVGVANRYRTYIEGKPRFSTLTPKTNSTMGEYYCIDTYMFKQVPLEKAFIYNIDVNEFLEEVVELFPLSSQKLPRVSTLYDGVLWFVGVLSLGEGQLCPVYVARNISLNLREIIAVLSEEKAYGVVLSTDSTIPELIRWPPGISVCRLQDVLVHDGYQVKINTPWLRTITRKPTATVKSIHSPVTFDEGSGVLFLQNKTPWKIQGVRQRKVVSYMVRQAHAGRWDLPQKEILTLGKGGEVSGAKQISTLFRSSELWKDYITRVGHGTYRLLVA